VRLPARISIVLFAAFVGGILLIYLRQASRNSGSENRAVVARPGTVVPTKLAVPRTVAPAEIVNSRTGSADPELVASARLMISPPPGTEMALQGIDPRRLRASFERGKNLMESATDDEQKINGARLVNSSAILGYELARLLIAREYPRSQLIQTAVTGSEAVRYSLDPLIVSSPIAQSGRVFLVLLASYFSGRNDLASYANYLLEALSDDHRLTDEDHLKELLAELAHVSGACLALGRAVVKARIVAGPACSSGLQLQLANFLQTTAPAGREAESRRRALTMLQE
jgi:hypothetical protein